MNAVGVALACSSTVFALENPVLTRSLLLHNSNVLVAILDSTISSTSPERSESKRSSSSSSVTGVMWQVDWLDEPAVASRPGS